MVSFISVLFRTVQHLLECPEKDSHCVKSVLIRNFSDPYFPAFGQNSERYSVTLV